MTGRPTNQPYNCTQKTDKYQLTLHGNLSLHTFTELHTELHTDRHRDRTNLIRGGERIDELFGNLLSSLELGGSERVRDVYENDKVLWYRRQRTHHDIPVEQTDITVKVSYSKTRAAGESNCPPTCADIH